MTNMFLGNSPQMVSSFLTYVLKSIELTNNKDFDFHIKGLSTGYVHLKKDQTTRIPLDSTKTDGSSEAIEIGADTDARTITFTDKDGNSTVYDLSEVDEIVLYKDKAPYAITAITR